MDSLERYLGDTYELVDTLKTSEQGFVVVVYDKRAKRLCMMKQRPLNSLTIYQTLKELNSPHVPQLYRLFERDGKLIVVEEHIDGQTLEELLIYQRVDEALTEKILLQLCDCLKVLHERNIIHRDLKPSNIMLTEAHDLKLIDFGIARVFKPESTSDTELMGTRGYAPPEQFGLFDFGQTDRRSDIYALGMTIKTLLGEDYDGRLKKVLDKCTALEPSQRFQTVEELRRAVLASKRSFKPRKLFVTLLIGLAIFFLPKTLEHLAPPPEEVPTPDETSQPKEEPQRAEQSSTSTTNFEVPTLPQMSSPEINLPTPAPLPEVKPPTIPAQVEESGEVELKLFLNGKQAPKEHMVYLYDWQTWARGKHQEYIFPDDWHARLRVENHSSKPLISPQIKIHVGYDEYSVDKPTLESGQLFELDIPLGGHMASPRKGRGNLQIVLQSEGNPPLFLNKTFFLVQ